MNPLTNPFSAKSTTAYQPYVNVDSYLSTAKDNFHNLPPAASVAIKSFPLQFTTALAHEVRNPLGNINLSVEMLESVIKEDEPKIYLDIIRRSSARINNLINEFLKERQADEVQAKRYSVQQLLDEVVEQAGDQIRLKNILVSKEYIADDCNLIMNRAQMKIAFTNIIINAIEAVNQDTGKLKLVTKSVDGKYVLRIEDNGCGIPKANLANIFKPYFTSKATGLGLGLAIAYDILLSNQVGVNIESKEGEGTHFILLFDENQ